MILLGEVPLFVLVPYAILLGLFGGSFLNVVVYRVPRGMNIARPPSHCPGCGAPVRFYDNVPVISYLVLRGRARCCQVRISPRYVVVEVIGGALGLALLHRVLLDAPPDTPLLRAAALFAAYLIFALALVAVAFIDLEHMYVPDAISIGGTLLGIATFSLRPGLAFQDVVVGALAGFVLVWLPFTVLYRWIRGRTGMGLGDAKLVMMAGAWFGWPGAVFALLAGAVQGTLVAVVLILWRGGIEEPESVRIEKEETLRAVAALEPEERARAEAELAKDPLYEDSGSSVGLSRIAFGPFLVIAMLEYLLAGPYWTDDSLRWLGISI